MNFTLAEISTVIGILTVLGGVALSYIKSMLEPLRISIENLTIVNTQILNTQRLDGQRLDDHDKRLENHDVRIKHIEDECNLRRKR